MVLSSARQINKELREAEQRGKNLYFIDELLMVHRVYWVKFSRGLMRIQIGNCVASFSEQELKSLDFYIN